MTQPSFVPDGGVPAPADMPPPQMPPTAPPTAPPTSQFATPGELASIRVDSYVALACVALTTVGNLTMVAILELPDLLGTPPVPSAWVTLATVLALLLGLAGFVGLCLWMMRIKRELRVRALPEPATWKVWASWWIPIYAWVGPYRVMTQLGQLASRPLGWLLGAWWAPWVISWLLDWTVDTANERSNGTLLSPQAAATVSIGAGVLSLVSFIALAAIIVRIASGATSPRRPAPPTAPPLNGHPGPNASFPPNVSLV